MSKSNSAAKSAKTAASQAEGQANQQMQNVQDQAEQVKQAGINANKQMTAVSQPTAEEQARLARYNTQSNTPAESLMTQAGPISQAVARRVQERVNNPGMDYDTNSQAFEQSVGTPVWAALKARGITPAPGDTTGGGLGTTQYMKSVVPYLASQRSNQINTDITRGQTYDTSANALQKGWTDLENQLGEAIQSRLQAGGLAGAAAEQTGATAGSQLNVSGTNEQTQNLIDQFLGRLKQAQGQAESYSNASQTQGDLLMKALTAALSGGMGGGTESLAPAGGVSSAAIPASSVYSTPTNPSMSMPAQQQARLLAALRGGSGVNYGL
jgi:hypothetical protein